MTDRDITSAQSRLANCAYAVLAGVVAIGTGLAVDHWWDGPHGLAGGTAAAIGLCTLAGLLYTPHRNSDDQPQPTTPETRPCPTAASAAAPTTATSDASERR